MVLKYSDFSIILYSLWKQNGCWLLFHNLKHTVRSLMNTLEVLLSTASKFKWRFYLFGAIMSKFTRLDQLAVAFDLK